MPTGFVPGSYGSIVMETLKQAAHLFTSLSEETRLRILNLLIDGTQLCVCDISEALNLTQSKASRHLAYLKNAGLVEDERRGLWIFYRLRPASGPIHACLLKCVRDCVAKLPQCKRDTQRERSVSKHVCTEEAAKG